MSKIAEKQAKKLFPFQSIEGGEIEAYFNAGQLHKREIYIECYNQAMKDFLWKACEWLKGNSKKYVVCYEDGYSHYAYNSMIEDFKNYMQDEEM